MAADNTKKLTLDSSFQELEKLQPFVDSLQQWTSCDNEKSSRIMLTLSEAVNNAIIHGNEEDPAKQVRITATADNEQLIITVKDEGDGFNPDNLDDPLKEENLLNEGGRGIYLIRQYADEVIFSENATRLTMRFDLEQG